MDDSKQMLVMLHEEFNRWEDLLARLNEDQIIAPLLPSNWSIKDVIAHLMAWQAISIVRLEAARFGREPILPSWLDGSDPESENDVDCYNERIDQVYRQQPWPRVYLAWKDGFLRFLDLADQIPKDDLLDAGKYTWLKGYTLFDVLKGSYEHHHDDHFEPLLDLIAERGKNMR
jgi:hypothetical protein